MGWRLVIVGEGPERAALERLADRDVADIVSFVGQQQDIGQWYDRARLFVMTSRHEGMPNAFIEALSRGLPTIVSRTCGDAPNYVETLRCGTIIDAEDTLASARVLDRLLSDEPLLKTMSHRAAGDLESSFGREAVIRAWESAFSTRPL
jgi:GalNAc-alpha-(1->4)-GalNAc-alpha-(1->3)-diNAcBac-PP-undecaprenol alpha-1,4-N-acetyl-D-galactosaminyltransferase